MSQTKKNLLVHLIPVIVIFICSLLSLVNFLHEIPSLSGLTMIFGLVYFFIYRRKMRFTKEEASLNEKTFIEDIKNNWILILAPSILNLISIGVSKFIIPKYIDHVIGRVDGFLSLDKIIILIFQFLVFAFGEEIVFRALVQKNLTRYMRAPIAIATTSLFFAIAHATSGGMAIIIYDLFFIFCNSVVYGIIFHKTNSTYASALSHFIANLSGMMILLSI